MRWSDISFSRTTLRQFAALWIVFFAALGLWYGFRLGHAALGAALLVLALVVGPLGLIWPQLIKPIYTIWMILVFPIGWTVSNLLLAVVYFGVVTPIAVVFRLIGRDALERRRRPERDSYWQAKAAPDNTGRYLRQY